MHTEIPYLREIVIFLVAAGLVIPLLGRLKISPVLGFLAVGVIIGPYGLARFSAEIPWVSTILISDLDGVRALSELGVIFLLFMIGLELSLSRLWSIRKAVFGMGGAQVVVTAVCITGVLIFLGTSTSVGIVLGGALALSSTAIVMELLVQNRRVGTSTGQAVFSVLLFQDLAVLPILFMVGALTVGDTGSVLPAFGLALGQAGLAVAAILVVGRLLIGPAFRLLGGSHNRELFLAAVLLVILGTATLTEMAGMSMALGAFLAGLVFAETEFRHEIEIDIAPFKGLFLALFFISVGMGINLAIIIADPWTILAGVATLILLKALIAYAVLRLFGNAASVSVEAALLLAQGGEFAFVVITLATALSLIPDQVVQYTLIIVSLSMIATPFLAIIARALALVIEAREAAGMKPHDDVPEDLEGHVVIAGYGRVGQLIGTILDEQGLPHIGVDRDAKRVSRFHRQGAAVIFGDAQHIKIMEKTGLERAAALVVTIDNPVAAERVVHAVRRQIPHLTIYARARDREHAARLVAQGANQVVHEALESSLQLGELALVEAGVPEDTARRLADITRQSEQGVGNA
ncbi:MAG: cation:proton antiporter [Pseudomonadota bacterium]